MRTSLLIPLTLLLPAGLLHAAPVINSLSPSTGPTSGGMPIDILGSGLDDNDPFINNNEPTVTFNNQPVVILGDPTPNKITFVLPAGQGTNYPVKVNFNGGMATKLFSYSPPKVTSVSGTSSTQGGGAVTIGGTNFGLTGTVTIGGQSAPVNSWSHTSISVIAPPGQGTNLPVVVATGGQVSPALNQFDYQPPSISGVVAGARPTAGGELVTVNGSNFGTNASVLVGGVAAALDSQSQTSLVFVLPEGQGTNVPLAVVVGGQASAPAYLDYDAPVIALMDPVEGPAPVPTEITLTGSNFGTSPTVAFGAGTGSLVSWSHTEVVFTRPAGEIGSLAVVVNAAGQASEPVYFDSTSMNCPPGYYIDTVLAEVLPVPPGRYAPDPDMTEPPLCPPGSYTPVAGMIEPIPASPGYIVPDPGASAQTPVPVGMYTDLPGQVAGVMAAPGTYAPVPGLQQGIPASPGYIVPDPGASAQTPVPVGMYTDLPGQVAGVMAVPGTYAPVPGLQQGIPASPGYYVDSPGAVDQTPAPAGKYVQDPGMMDALECPAGQYTPVAGMRQPILASPGYYVPDPGASVQLAAPAGSHTPTPGMGEALLCSAGSYTPVAGMQFEIPASPGYFVPAPGASKQQPAGAGTVAQQAGMANALPTLPGTYTPVDGMSVALAASPGHFVSAPGMADQTPAPPGTYVSLPGSVSATVAEAGTYAPIAGMRASIPAPDGTYASSPGATEVQPVPAGYQSDGSSITPLPEVLIATAEVLPGGDFQISFSTNAGETYGIFYTENLSDYVLVQTEAGTGSDVQVTVAAPNPNAANRFWVVSPVDLP